MTRHGLILLALAGAFTESAVAQDKLYPVPSAYAGVEMRRYNFADGFAVDAIRQVSIPVAVLIPVGRRLSIDISTAYASTFVYDTAGAHESFNELTDTQIRAAYVLRQDALVATLMVNLPTGKETVSLRSFGTAAASSSPFLAFPVSSYGAGTSVTGGAAAVFKAGSWSLGASSSLRVSSEYQPFSDAANSSIRYKPGVEVRFRLGADRLIGSSRLTLGATSSTFSNDQFSGLTGSGTGEFSPGTRFIFDAAFLTPVGRGTINFYAWDYLRGSSSDGSSTVGVRENVLTMGAAASFPLGGQGRAAFEPLVEARVWSPENGSGHLFGAGAAFRFGLGAHLMLVPSGRFDFGKLAIDPISSRTVTGWDASALLRYSF